MSCPVREDYLPFRGYRTWYRIVGDLASTLPPLLLLHGGPGLSHRTLLPLAAVADTGRPVIFYDQLGCGRSDRPASLAEIDLDLYIDELTTLRRALGLERLHLLGHSWGGVLGLEYVLTRPAGVLSLTLHSSLAVSAVVYETRRRAYATLPDEIRVTLEEHKRAGTISSPAYQAAAMVFYRRYVCRLEPWPDWLVQEAAEMNVALNHHLYTSNLPRIGPLNRYDNRDRLRDVAVPTLVIGGRYDGAASGQEVLLHARIPGAELVLFEESSHYAHAEEPQRFLAVLTDFLALADGG